VSQEQVQPFADAFGLSEESADPDADDATARLERRIAQLQTNLRELRAENLELRDEVENPSFQRLASAVAGDGLLGFLQILWDPNRQAMHDKIVGTVVIMDKPESSARRGTHQISSAG